jgi:hypothetical protein
MVITIIILAIIKKIREILVKEESMKKFMELPQPTPMSSHSQEEEDKLHMLDKDPIQKLILWFKS